MLAGATAVLGDNGGDDGHGDQEQEQAFHVWCGGPQNHADRPHDCAGVCHTS